MFGFSYLEIALMLLGFSIVLQTVTAGLILTAMSRAKKSDERMDAVDSHIAEVDKTAQKTLAKATAANFAAAGILELDA